MSIRDELEKLIYESKLSQLIDRKLHIREEVAELSQAILAEVELMIGEEEKHFCLLSNKELEATGKLIEGRTLEDWIKFGRNKLRTEIKAKLHSEGVI